uniref:Elongator complex protein 1 n=1 Tax=Tanacetum cinerariifolium TaxID=118510 RepID=A0A6L2L0S4_TANCI|nr:elongator complex protein 1 [Tanacetum cinerariifolium]
MRPKRHLGKIPTRIEASLREHLASMERPDKISNEDRGGFRMWFANQIEESWGKPSPTPLIEAVDLDAGDSITSLEYLMEKEALIIGTSSGCSPGNPATWRGDGKFFATISSVQNSLQKKLKVWERDTGNLHSVSEPKASMGEIVEWMPSGAKIATVCDQKIVFFEKNGLERNSFSVGEGIDATIENLKWNCNSDLLAAIVRRETYDSVKIWSFSNNHWYLKHDFRYSKQDGVRFMWDPVKPLSLISWTLKGLVKVYDFVWITAVTENSVALVVDGSKVLVTPLSLTLIPPPMYLFELQFPCSVREMAFWSNNSKNCLAASLADGSLSVVELPSVDTWEELEGEVFRVELCITEALTPFYHLTWLDSHVLFGVTLDTSYTTNELSKYCLQELELVCSEDHIPGSIEESWGKPSPTPLIEAVDLDAGDSITSLEYLMEKEALIIGTSSGVLLLYNVDDNVMEVVGKVEGGVKSLSPSPDGDLLCVITGIGQMLVMTRDWDLLYETALEDTVVEDADVHGSLSVVELPSVDTWEELEGEELELVCSEDHIPGSVACSGFDAKVVNKVVLERMDIVFGQTEAKYGNFVPVVVTKKNAEEGKKFIQIWEKGSKILGAVHGDESAVIIQTIRGNLESIYPRKLVLESIVNALVQGRFKDALLMVRRHRIDFNVIVDHGGWQAFLQLAAEFVRQADNLSHITDFVCSLKNENVMETLYKNYISYTNAETGKESSDSKVNSVLLAVRKALEEQIAESPARELCILTTLARSDPPSLEEALQRVKVIREMELSDSPDPKRKLFPSAEESLKHLLWLSETEAVYEAALGLYDLNLAAIVALNSQQDPKEFLPFLQELEVLPSLIMRYRIDLKLKRHQKALQHILLTDPIRRRQVCEAWGDHLSNIKCFEDAATTYLCCSSLEKALKAYRASNNWGGVITVAGLMKLGKEEIMQLAHDLCEELQTIGKPSEAAKIAFDYCGDVKNGITLLISAREWEEALRIALMHGREDLISDVKIGAGECATILITEYEEGLEKIGKYLTRYLAVRQRRLLFAAKLQADDRSINELDDDTVSEASSSFSGMSAYTTGYELHLYVFTHLV